MDIVYMQNHRFCVGTRPASADDGVILAVGI